IRQILALMSAPHNAGVVYPQMHESVPYIACGWLANAGLGRVWCERLGVAPVPRGYFDFPVGNMYWATARAIWPLLTANLTVEDFPEEAGQTDGTLAHCLERLPVLVARRQGFTHAILKSRDTPSWSPWRFDEYLSQTKARAEQ